MSKPFDHSQPPLLADMHTDGVRFDRSALAAFQAKKALAADKELNINTE